MTRSRTERKTCREILTDFIRSHGDGYSRLQQVRTRQ
jgi:hypothetical protein